MRDFKSGKAIRNKKVKRKAIVPLRERLKKYFTAFFVALMIVGTYYIYSSIPFKSVFSGFDFFKIRNVSVSGNSRVLTADIVRLSGLGINGESLLTINMKEMAKNIRRSPWISDVRIVRVFPDTLKIDIHERVPYALWRGKHLSLVDESGFVFKEAVIDDSLDLPVITVNGERGSFDEAFGYLERALKEDFFKKEGIAELSMDNQRVTIITEKTGFEIAFGFRDFEERVKNVGKIVRAIERNSYSVSYIDLSARDDAVIKLKNKTVS